MSKLPVQSFKLQREGLAHIFGELEAKLMEAVWTLKEARVQDVIEHLGGNLHYKTAMTVMNRLVDKGLLTRQKTGRAFIYRAVMAKDELLAGVFDQMVRGMFDDDFRQLAIAQMVETAEAIDPQLLEDISRLIEQRKKNDPQQ